MTKAQKLYTISSTRVLMRGCFIALFVTAALAALPCSVQADMLLFWNFDEYTTEGGVNYVTDTVHSERLKLVNSSIVDGQLTANGGYAQGTVEGTNGVNVTLPTGTASYTLSAFLTTRTNGAVGIIAWGVSNATRQTNSFRTDTSGLKNYWWSDDLSVTGFPEVYSGIENHVVATGSGRTQTLYLNGQLIGTRGANGDRNEQNQAFTVGNTVNNNTETLYGTIDNASVYNDVMAHTDIINISSSRYNGLTNWWKAGETIDRVGGVVKPATVTGTTVITGTNGDVMVFNRALTAGEQAYYQGQLASEHAYVNSMADSDPAKTTWISASTADLSDAAQTPLGIYVGGMNGNTTATLTATAQQLNEVNHTLVLGNGTLEVSSDSPVSFDTNKVNFDGGSVTIAASNNITFNSDSLVNVRTVTMGASSSLTFNSGSQVAVRTVSSAANSILEFNASDKIQVLNGLSGSGTVVFSGSATTTLFSKSTSFTGTLVVKEGNELVFTTQDTFNDAHNNGSAKIVVDGGTITNTGTVYEYLTNVTMKNGGQIYAATGNATWEAFKIFNLSVVRNDDGSAAAPVRIAADMSNPNATVSFGPQSNQVASTTTTIKVEDITSASGSSDNISDLVISSVITDPTTVNTGFKTAGAINKTGAGTMELAATNVYRGTTTISNGTLALTAPNAVYNSQAIINNSAITTTADQTLRNLSGNGTVTANDNNLTLISDRSTTFSGTISGVDTLSAEGQGPLNVTGATISTANLEVRQDSVVNVPAANAITVTESFRQSNSAQFTFTGASASVSGSNISAQAAITLNGGTMSFNTFAYETSPSLPDYEGLALHLDASVASSFDNSSAISTWTNLADSSNNLTLANASGSNTAHVTQNAKNGLNVVTFPTDGSANYNLASAINGVTYFAVMADNGNTSDSAYSFLFGNSGGSDYFFHRGTGSTLWHPRYTNANIKNGSTILNGISVPYDAADIGYDWNVMSIKATSAVSLTAISRDRNIANRGWHGDVAEILVYTTALTDAQIKSVSQYLATKWQVGTDVIAPSVVTTGEFASNNTFIVAESSTIDVGSFTKVTFGTTTINQNKKLSVNVAENQTTELNAVISGGGDLIKTGDGTMTLSNRNSDFSGNVVIDEGTLKAVGGWSGGASGTTVFGKNQAKTVTINEGAEVIFASQDVVTNADHTTPIKFIVNGGTITNEGAYFNNLSNTEFYNGAKLVAANGNETWKAFMLTGTTKVAFAGNGSTAENPVVFEVASTATGDAKTNATICPYGTTFDVADITKSDASDLVINAVLANTNGTGKIGSFTKTGAGTMELTNNANSFTGNIVVNEGVLKASKKWTGVGTGKNTTVFGYYQSKTVTVNSGAEVILAVQDAVSDSSHSSPIQFIIDGGKISNEGAVYNNLNNTVFKNGGELYASNGSGSWKAYKLSTKVSALRDAPSAQPAKITASTNGNATISFGNGTSLYVEDVTSASATELDTKSDLIISAIITTPHNEDNRTFYKDGVGILEFTADNTFNGNVGVRVGVLRLSGDGSLGSSTVTISDGATLEFLHTANKSFSNVFKGEGDVLKAGTGKLTLSGANTYTGMTTVSAGVLELTGDAVVANGPMTIGTGGTLEYNLANGQTKKLSIDATNKILSTGKVIKTGEGTLQLYSEAQGLIDISSLTVSSGRVDLKGYMTGNITVDSGGVFSPGNSVGEATFGGGYILKEGATLLIEMDGSGIDKLNVDSFTFDETSISQNIELDITGVPFGSEYEVITSSDLFTGSLLDENYWLSHFKSDLPEYMTLSIKGDNTVILSINRNSVPEPSTWALLIIGVAGLMYWRRRK